MCWLWQIWWKNAEWEVRGWLSRAVRPRSRRGRCTHGLAKEVLTKCQRQGPRKGEQDVRKFLGWGTYHLGVRKKIGAAKVDVIESSQLTFGNSEASETRC